MFKHWSIVSVETANVVVDFDIHLLVDVGHAQLGVYEMEK
jgi:hypothetical protein